MKSIFFIFLITLVTGVKISNAQIVNIPDANFKNALLSHNPVIDLNSDGQIQVSEAQAFNGTMNVFNKNISDLTGISAFSSMNVLFCDSNQLTSLNLNNNVALQVLNCSHNQLPTIDLSNNVTLQSVSCGYNQLTSLILGNNGALQYLYCNNNQLSSLNISNNTALLTLDCKFNQLNSLNINANTALAYLYCSYNQLTTLNLNSNAALVDLHCENNQLSALNFSGNPNLYNLGCNNNQLTSLNLSSNMALHNLYCYSNQISSLNVSNNLLLLSLDCGNNQLTSLDLSNTSLASLACYNNQLTSLDLANGYNQNLGEFIALNNPNLSCIKVDDSTYSANNWVGFSFIFDPWVSFSNNCLPVSINQAPANASLSIYPNPAGDIVKITNLPAGNKTIKIMDVAGMEIYNSIITNQTATINTSGFSNGIYIISINGNSTISNCKLVIDK